MLLYERSSRLTFNKLIAFVNPSDPNSDQHVISPYNNTYETFTKIVRIKEMITYEALIIRGILLVST